MKYEFQQFVARRSAVDYQRRLAEAAKIKDSDDRAKAVAQIESEYGDSREQRRARERAERKMERKVERLVASGMSQDQSVRIATERSRR